ncbi:MAG: SH3 domain-containing protein [Gammaproteobacteria bacterium]|nr:SH3 domain-containing protein [Gammaproteobacteria bacterium]
MARITQTKTDTAKQLVRGILLCLMPLLSLPTQAEFVTDKIVIEVRSQRLSQGAVLKTLSSGSTVEVLMTDGDYSRVRTNDNITGWVQSQFLTKEQPTQIEYLKLLAKSKTLEAKLKVAETNSGDSGGDGIDIAEIEELRKRAADAGWMRVELKKARERIVEIENKMKSSSKTTNSSQEELNTLRNQNKELQARLAASILVSEQQQEVVMQEDGSLSIPTTTNQNASEHNPDDQGWTVNIEWFLGSIVVALILGLIGGMTWLDKRMRQRHGGFRLY